MAEYEQSRQPIERAASEARTPQSANGAAFQRRRSGTAAPYDVMDSPRMVAQRQQLSRLFGNAPVQRYAQVGTLQISESENYVLDENDRSVLWVKPGVADLPDFAFSKDGSKSFDAVGGGVAYQGFVGKLKFGAENNPNDCGMYANALARGKQDWQKEELLTIDNKPVPSRKEGLIGPFERWEAAPLAKKAEVAKDQFQPASDNKEPSMSMQPFDVYELSFHPKTSEELKNRGFCPHHAATVIAVDNGDEITHEANAANKGQKFGQFFMYGKRAGQNFYEKNIGYFMGAGIEKFPNKTVEQIEGTPVDQDKSAKLERLIRRD